MPPTMAMPDNRYPHPPLLLDPRQKYTQKKKHNTWLEKNHVKFPWERIIRMDVEAEEIGAWTDHSTQAGKYWGC